MSEDPLQPNELPLQPSLAEPLKAVVIDLLGAGRQPSAWELLREVETKLGLKARWELQTVLEQLSQDNKLIPIFQVQFSISTAEAVQEGEATWQTNEKQTLRTI